MPKVLIYESRRLILPLETVVDAVLGLDRERGGRLWTATITDARIQTGPSPGLILEAQQPDAVAAEERFYPLAAVAAAAIHYCWMNKVPLPRNATKSIDIVPEGFALSLQGIVEIQRRHEGFTTSARSGPASSAAQGHAAPADSTPDAASSAAAQLPAK